MSSSSPLLLMGTTASPLRSGCFSLCCFAQHSTPFLTLIYVGIFVWSSQVSPGTEYSKATHFLFLAHASLHSLISCARVLVYVPWLPWRPDSVRHAPLAPLPTGVHPGIKNSKSSSSPLFSVGATPFPLCSGFPSS